MYFSTRPFARVIVVLLSRLLAHGATIGITSRFLPHPSHFSAQASFSAKVPVLFSAEHPSHPDASRRVKLACWHVRTNESRPAEKRTERGLSYEIRLGREAAGRGRGEESSDHVAFLRLRAQSSSPPLALNIDLGSSRHLRLPVLLFMAYDDRPQPVASGSQLPCPAEEDVSSPTVSVSLDDSTPVSSSSSAQPKRPKNRPRGVSMPAIANGGSAVSVHESGLPIARRSEKA